jgi:hypothetical protein
VFFGGVIKLSKKKFGCDSCDVKKKGLLVTIFLEEAETILSG